MQKLFGFLGFLILSGFAPITGGAATEPGFRDSLKVFKVELVYSADASLRELSRRFNVPISFESRIGPLFADPSSIVVKFDLESAQQVEVKIVVDVIGRGFLSLQDEKRLTHVMTALISESLPSSAVMAGIQYLQNSLETRVAEGSSSIGWEKPVFMGLVIAFVLLVALTYFLEGTNQHSTYPPRPFEG